MFYKTKYDLTNRAKKEKTIKYISIIWRVSSDA